MGNLDIQNLTQLTHHGNGSLREAAATILDHALDVSDPYSAVNRMLQIHGERQSIK